ncbi:MAG: sodium ion-translocating decarboxylase subunit beta [Rikenellaceae bacterium]|nr:sodium ion-translocating decarboxylase subunit beta [Rikenellaceae bacterium]MCL2692075.1 sodium ion-translocating decarboxylase subunit beta [Rikenellaceae bacterium]
MKFFESLSSASGLLAANSAGTYSMGLTEISIPQIIMVLIGLFFVYLAIVKKYEPLLLLPLAFGIVIANIPMANLSAYSITLSPDAATGLLVERQGLLNFLYDGIRYVIYPPLIFLCIGTMTDFGPLISSPKTAFIGLGGQLGIFVAFFGALFLGKWLGGAFPGFEGFSYGDAASIGIIGSSDGPTSIYAASRMAPELLPMIAIAAFSYMALVPFIQPPIMRMLTTPKERVVVMPKSQHVTQKQKILFPIAMTLITLLLVPTAGALIGMLMLGNLLRESGVTARYLETLQGPFLNILTILVALSIGASTTAELFLTPQTLIIVFLGLIAFCFGTAGGVLIAKLLYKLTGGKVNPLIGNSGVSAMPMAARISQKVGQEYNSKNYLLMHAMGPLVSSTIASAIIAGIFISLYA